jgi:hypothetical protein
MKKIALVIILLLCWQQASAQTLKLDEVLFLYTQDVSTINTSLISRGWELHDTNQDEVSTNNTWLFKVNPEDSKEAKFWVAITDVSFQTNIERLLLYQVHDIPDYEALKKEIIAKGLVEIEHKKENDKTIYSYKVDEYILLLTSGGTQKKPFFHAQIMSSILYEKLKHKL